MIARPCPLHEIPLHVASPGWVTTWMVVFGAYGG
jgi:hypothetical protein